MTNGLILKKFLKGGTMTKQELREAITHYNRTGNTIPFNSLTADNIDPADTVGLYEKIDNAYQKAKALSVLFDEQDQSLYFRTYWDLYDKIKNPKIYCLFRFKDYELVLMDLMVNYEKILNNLTDIEFL